MINTRHKSRIICPCLVFKKKNLAEIHSKQENNAEIHSKKREKNAEIHSIKYILIINKNNNNDKVCH